MIIGKNSPQMRISGFQILVNTREQCLGIHEIVNDQGFAMHYRVISNTVGHLEVFRCEIIITAKLKDGSQFKVKESFKLLLVIKVKNTWQQIKKQFGNKNREGDKGYTENTREYSIQETTL